MVGHNNKSIKPNATFFRQKSHGVGNDRFVFIRLQQVFPTFNGSGAEIEIRISSCRKWFHEVFRFYRQVLRFLIHLSGSLCYTWAAGRRHCGGAELGIGVEKMEDGECWKVDCARDKEHLPRLNNRT